MSLLDEIFEDERFRESVSVGWLDARPVVRGKNFRVSLTLDDIRGYPPARPDYRNTAQDAAHILFTSGSTGTPKGVVITHSNVIHFVEWATRYFQMTSADRVSAHPPLHFDLSVFDIFGAFAVGAQLHLVPREEPDGEGWWQPLNRLKEAGLPTLYRKAAELALAYHDRLAA